MRIVILSVGKMKSGPERDLVDDYLRRAGQIGKRVGVRAVEEIEVASGNGRDAEAKRALDKLPKSAQIVLLDERGKSLRSEDFSKFLKTHAEDAVPELVFVIGGADGHGKAIASRADFKLSLGAATWPHRLLRAMLAEQIYRAFSIQQGLPYHKD